MSARVLLNLLNEFGNSDVMRGLHMRYRGSYMSAHVLLN